MSANMCLAQRPQGFSIKALWKWNSKIYLRPPHPTHWGLGTIGVLSGAFAVELTET